MNTSLLYRTLLMLGLTLAAIVILLPTIWQPLPDWLGFLKSSKVSLGLDLQGGTHLVMQVDTDQAVSNSLEVNADELRRELRKAGVRAPKVERVGTGLQVTIPADQRSTLIDVVAERYPNLKVGESETADGTLVQRLGLSAEEIRAIKQAAVEQSLETIRNRVDQFGVAEPIIQRQGERDLLIQLPGVQDPERAKELIGKTAVLEFKLVRDVNAEPFAKGNQTLPSGTEVLYEIMKSPSGERRKGAPLLLESQTLMTGDVVTDARVRPGDLPGSRIVSLDLNQRGARLFGEITAANVRRRLAIVLDDTIYSAPVIQEAIPGGKAVISGSFTTEEAKDLAIVLRSGALPAPVSVAEERTVGPTLGRDSIRQGIRSFIVAGALVMLFMVIYYRFAGLLADMALIWNVLFMVAALAAFNATLTLPGIAGIVLTLGMAVDANVLINERIREELRLGKSPRAAVEAGYDRALPAILDSNITTLLSGIILFQFGSGPIKGFAVTLCIGLVSHVFTAVVGTRLVWDYLLSRRQLRSVSI
ncbi:MAG: protein translocase subunit SecD [Candidatus Binatia bacterium]